MSESFSELFEQSLASQRIRPGTILNGLVVEVGQDYVVVNVGLNLWLIPASSFSKKRIGISCVSSPPSFSIRPWNFLRITTARFTPRS